MVQKCSFCTIAVYIADGYSVEVLWRRVGIKTKNEVFGGSSTHERAPPAVLATIVSQPSDFLNQPKTTNLKWTLKLRCKDKDFFNSVQVFY